MTTSLTADELELAELEREGDRVRWAAVLARGRVVKPLIEAMLAVPGTTPADAARTLRVWADMVEGGVWPGVEETELTTSPAPPAGSTTE